LREPVASGLARADALVLMQSSNGRDTWRVPGPVAHFARPQLMAWLESEHPPRLQKARVLAFAGIARPERFFRALTELGLKLAGTAAFPDHYAFTARDWTRLLERAAKLEAPLVTTAKDAARLTREQRQQVHIAPARVHFDDDSMLDALLDTVLAR